MATNKKRWTPVASSDDVIAGDHVRVIFTGETEWTICTVNAVVTKRGKRVLDVEDGETGSFLNPADTAVELFTGDGKPTDEDRATGAAPVDEDALMKKILASPDFQKRLDALAKNATGYKGIELTINKVVVGKIEGRVHCMYEQVIDAVRCGFNNIMLVGPMGCGKSTLVEQIAQSLKLPFNAQTFTSGTPESVLTGRMIPSLKDGKEHYSISKYAELYEKGGCYLGDEMDAADANFMLTVNTSLANGHMTLPNGKTIKRHAKFYFFGAANTFGHGATRMYVGRNQLDGATLDRFVGATFYMDYDRELEKVLAGKAEASVAALNRIWTARQRIEQAKMRRALSTRAVVACARWVAGGKDATGALRQVFVGWTRDELSQVNELACTSEG